VSATVVETPEYCVFSSVRAVVMRAITRSSDMDLFEAMLQYSTPYEPRHDRAKLVR
jgi:hypothetical protein